MNPQRTGLSLRTGENMRVLSLLAFIVILTACAARAPRCDGAQQRLNPTEQEHRTDGKAR